MFRSNGLSNSVAHANVCKNCLQRRSYHPPAKALLYEGGRIAALTYGWLCPEHPDPHGWHAQAVRDWLVLGRTDPCVDSSLLGRASRAMCSWNDLHSRKEEIRCANMTIKAKKGWLKTIIATWRHGTGGRRALADEICVHEAMLEVAQQRLTAAERLNCMSDAFAQEQSQHGNQGSRKIAAIFWDFLSLPQKDPRVVDGGERTAEEARTFGRALKGMLNLYGSARVVVIQHKAIPPVAWAPVHTLINDRPYDARGWCCVEETTAHSSDVFGKVVDVGKCIAVPSGSVYRNARNKI